MEDTLSWWLAVELIGLFSFPLCFIFLRSLPDRGYSLSKILGLLLLGYLLWLGATARIIPNERWSIILIVVLLGCTGVALALRQRGELAGFFQAHWPYVLIVEGVFAVTLSAAVFLRSYIPDIGSSQAETFVDFAHINAILRSEYFPPNDPWLAGHSIPIYYFGHLVVAMLARLTGVASEIAYNLGLGLFLSLAALGIFGLVYNLVAGRARPGWAIASGLAALLLLVVMGNIEGFFELLAAHGVGSAGFYKTLDFFGLDGPRSTTEWYPTEFYWYGRAIIISGPAGDRDFPFHSFLEGYLHGHSMGIPFFLAALAAALNLWRWPGLLASGIGGWRLALAAATGVVLGGTAFVNIIDFPTAAVILVATLATKAWLQERRFAPEPFLRAAVLAAAIIGSAVVLFLPYYLNFTPEGSLRPMEAAHQLNLGQELGLNITSPHHLIYTWLPFFWLTAALAAGALARGRVNRAVAAIAAAPAVLVVLAWAAAVLAGSGVQALTDDVDVREWNWLTVLLLGSMLTFTLLSLLGWLRRGDDDDEAGGPAPFVLVMGVVTLLLLLGIELFWVKVLPRAEDRFWSALHVNYQAWIMLSVTSAFAIYYVLSNWRPKGWLQWLAHVSWVGVALLVVAAAFVYPVAASFSRTAGFAGPRSMRALAGVQRFAPAEYEAVGWLSANAAGAPVVLEAVGDSYTAFGRVATFTGLPTLLAWPSWHETQWRHTTDFVEPRTQAAERIYTTPDPAEARALLEEYDVEYVYVGPLELQQYGQAGLAKFGAFMDTVFENDQVKIYRMRPK